MNRDRSARRGRRGHRPAVEGLEPRLVLAASSGFVPPTMPQTATNFTQTVKVLVLDYDPLVPSAGNRRLHEVQGWNDPHALAAGYKADMEYAGGGAVQFQIVEFRELNELPADVAGYRLTPDQYVANWRAGGGWHTELTDYYRMAAEQNVAALVNGGQVDEVWTFGAPFVGGGWESWMWGPGAFFINGGTYPDLGLDRAVAAYGFNYERGVAEMIHDNGHRTENHLVRSFGGTWNGTNPATAWEKFAAVAGTTATHVGGVGNTHFPVNGTSDYDYGNATPVASTANDWLNYPNLTGATTTVGRSAWSSPSATDTQRDYLQWFFGHVPRNAGTTADGRQNNWFKYIYDFNGYEATTGLPRHESATLSAATLKAAGGTTYTFTVRYYDQTGIDPATLDGNDLQVTGPGGFSQLAVLDSKGTAQTTTAGTARTATYHVTAPGGTWDAADAGAYTVSMRSAQVKDTLGNAVTAGTLGTFLVNFPDPTAVDVNALVKAGQATVAGTAPDIGSFADLFDGDAGTLYRSANTNPAVVQVAFAAPRTFRGFKLFAAAGGTNYQSWTVETADTQADLDGRTGSWRRAVPTTTTSGGSFSTVALASPVTARFVKLTATKTQGDNYVHLYEFTLLGPADADAAGPTAALAAVPAVTTAGGTNTFLLVTFADAHAVRTATVRTGDVRVTGPNGFDQLATFYSLDDYTDGPTRTATYYVVPPGGAWDSADNGVYTASLQPSEVFDSFGNAAAGATLGTFAVNVAPPATRPPADLAESNAALWTAWAEGGTASVSDDTSRKVAGAASIKFVTDGGFDTYLRFPPKFTADWDLTAARNLSFSVYAQNANSPQFQNGSPWIRLTDAAGNYAQYQYYQNGGAYDLLNDALNNWRSYTVPLNAGAATQTGWRRTVPGAAPDMAHIQSVEFHADTWGAGFTLWYDRVGFDVPALVSAAAVNDGAAQRSMVRGLTVTFDRPVVPDAGAFQLVGRNGAGAGVTTTWANPSGDGMTWLASFFGAGVAGGSLPDGVYDVTVVASKSHSGTASGPAMAADYAFKFHRLYSDADGDGDSDNLDLLSLRPTYLKPSTDPAYRWYFDYDQSGVVDNLDVFQIRSRRAVVFQGY